MNLIETIISDKTFIIARDPQGQFKAKSDIIAQTQYAMKSKGEPPFPNSTTTWGPRYVKLVWNFLTFNQIIRTGILIHEATHSQQYDRHGTFGFYMKYLFSDFEKEAYAAQAQWLHKFGYHL